MKYLRLKRPRVSEDKDKESGEEKKKNKDKKNPKYSKFGSDSSTETWINRDTRLLIFFFIFCLNVVKILSKIVVGILENVSWVGPTSTVIFRDWAAHVTKKLHLRL